MDTVDPVRFLLSFVIVIGLMSLAAYLLKRFYGGKLRMPILNNLRGNGMQGRLSVEEVIYLDARRRIVIVKRDDVEHVLLLGDGREQLIETIRKDKS